MAREKCPAGHVYEEHGILDSQGKARCQICLRSSWREASRKYAEKRSVLLASARKEEKE